MKVALIVAAVLLGLVQFSYSQTAPVAGNGRWAASFDGTQDGAWVELGSNGFSNALGPNWTFQLWFMSRNPRRDTFKPLVSQFIPGNQGNALQGFNLQIWPNGQLSFFMGNGVSTARGYGIFWASTDAADEIAPGVWYHISVVFQSSEVVAPFTPDSVTVYLNGVNKGSAQWNGGLNSTPRGQRQAFVQPINIGRFDNADPGIQVLSGAVDELSFWNTALNETFIASSANRNKKLSGNEANLVAYYDFNDRSGAVLDRSAASLWDASFNTYANGPTFSYALSGADLWVWVDVPNNKKPTIITLAATDATASVNQYFLERLPSGGRTFSVGALNSIGAEILDVSEPLSSNKFAFLPNEGFVNANTYTDYRVRNSYGFSASSRVNIRVTEGEDVPPLGGCDGAGGQYDDCGVCNGDGLSCTCLQDQYRNYSLNELDRILVHFNIEFTLDLIAELEGTLRNTLLALLDFEVGSELTVNLDEAVKVVQEFQSTCLSPFSEDMDDFLTDLRAASIVNGL